MATGLNLTAVKPVTNGKRYIFIERTTVYIYTPELIGKIKPEENMETTTKRERASQKRRQKIVEAALFCFLDKGFNQTGIRAIAEKAGISLGNLYNYFPSKNAVLVEIANLEKEELTPFKQLLANDSNPLETLKTFVQQYVTYTAQPESVKLTAEILGEAVRNREIAALFLENRAGLVSALQNLLERGVSTGDFHSLDDPKGVAELILDAMEGYAVRVVIEQKEPDAEITTLISFFENAVCQSPSAINRR